MRLNGTARAEAEPVQPMVSPIEWPREERFPQGTTAEKQEEVRRLAALSEADH